MFPELPYFALIMLQFRFLRLSKTIEILMQSIVWRWATCWTGFPPCTPVNYYQCNPGQTKTTTSTVGFSFWILKSALQPCSHRFQREATADRAEGFSWLAFNVQKSFSPCLAFLHKDKTAFWSAQDWCRPEWGRLFLLPAMENLIATNSLWQI